MIPFKQIHAMARKRYLSHNKRCQKLGKPSPLETDFITLLANCYNAGWKCHYCGKALLFDDVPPYRDVASIDHYVPLDWNGASSIDNLRVCCHACNIVKGTMRGDTFEMLYKAIGNTPLWERIVGESFRGKFANKLERTEKEGSE